MVLCDCCNIAEAVQKHHKKYFPEETVPVCDDCHKRIHSGLYPFLTAEYIHYKPGDAKIFYSQQKKINGFLVYLNKLKRKK